LPGPFLDNTFFDDDAHWYNFVRRLRDFVGCEANGIAFSELGFRLDDLGQKKEQK